jgi:predicted nucleic acid-binding protein
LKFYFDSAYIAKCYLNEADGAEVRELARKASGLYSSSLGIAELACVFHRQVREGSIGPDLAAVLRNFFLEDLKNEVWALIPVTDRLLHRVEFLTRSLPVSSYIRAGDAIHLASALEYGFDEIWSNDRHLLAAATGFGLKGRSVPLK